MALHPVNEARRLKHVDWAGTRKVYETTPISIREIARQLGCNRNTVSRRVLREQWRKAKGIRHNECTPWRTLDAMRERHRDEDFKAQLAKFGM